RAYSINFCPLTPNLLLYHTLELMSRLFWMKYYPSLRERNSSLPHKKESFSALQKDPKQIKYLLGPHLYSTTISTSQGVAGVLVLIYSRLVSPSSSTVKQRI